MAAKPDVKVVIAGDTKGLEKSLKSSSKALGGFKTVALGTFAGNLMGKGLDLAIDGLRNLASFAFEGVDAFDELGDSLAILDGLAKGLGGTVDKLDLTKFGVDRNEAAKGAKSIANAGKSLGLTNDQLEKVVPNLTTMGAQLASLGDGDPVKQAELLAKALGGNAKAAKALGIQLPKGAKGLKAYQAIVRQLKPRLDKATDGQASLADVGERWDAVTANLQLRLGGMLDKLAPVISSLMDQLLPVLDRIVDEVGPIVVDVIGRIADAFKGLEDNGSIGVVADLLRIVVDLGRDLVTVFLDDVVPMFTDVAGAVAETLEPLLPKIAGVWDKLKPALESFMDLLSVTLVPLLKEVVIPAFGALLDVLLTLADAFLVEMPVALRFYMSVLKVAAAALDIIFGRIQAVVDKLDDAFRRIKDALGNLGNLKLPDLSGIIPGGTSTSSSGFAVAGAAGVTVNITTGVGDPVAIGRTVRRYLKAFEDRGG